MTNEEYKSARKELKMSVPEWIEKLGISRDTHKKYNSGAIPIQLPVVNHIKTMIEKKVARKCIKCTKIT
ncbi:TPA: hypothetical protein ACNUS5_002437 [Vibrio cholerae]